MGNSFGTPGDVPFTSGAYISQIGLSIPSPALEAIIGAHTAASGHTDVGPFAAINGEVIDLHGFYPASPVQMILSGEFAYVLLGALQGFADRAQRLNPVGRVDQLDALRADSRKRWTETVLRLGMG